MTEIFKFENQDIRFVGTPEEPWWVAVDICQVLEHSNPSSAIARIDDDDKKLFDPKQYLGSASNSEFWAINESGLYSLILTSRKPEAKRFKKWITSEVLPTLRKTGTYSIQQKQQPKPLLAITEALAFANIGAESARTAGVDTDIVEQLKLDSIMKMFPQSVPLLQPQKDAIAAQNPVFELPLTPTEIGKLVADKLGVEKVSAKAINRKLLNLGYQISITRINSKQKEVHDHYQATEKGKDYSQLQMSGYTDGAAKTTKAQLRWFKSIVPVLANNWEAE